MVLYARLFGFIGLGECNSWCKGNASDDEAGGNVTDHDLLQWRRGINHANAWPEDKVSPLTCMGDERCITFMSQ